MSTKHLRIAKERETKELLDRMAEVFYYDHVRGELRYKVDRKGGTYKGDIAGHTEKSGYTRVWFCGTQYMVHRIAWALYYGEWPKHTIDHKNKIRSDNRITNLRDVPQHVNNQNKRPYKKRR